MIKTYKEKVNKKSIQPLLSLLGVKKGNLKCNSSIIKYKL